MKITLASLLLVFITVSTFGQTYASVPITDPAYDFIDTMILKGVIRREVMVRPWPRSKVLSILNNVESNKEMLNNTEREYLQFLIDRTDLSIEKKASEQGAFDIESKLFPAKVGMRWENELMLAGSDDIAFSGLTILDFYLTGDVPGHISYNFQVRAGLYSIDFDSYEPYTYSRQWDGAPYHLVGYEKYGFPSELSGGLEIQSEISGSYWDDKFWMRFGRVRRDWGSFGSGNLFFAEQARPFTAFELTFNPWKWFSFSALTGSLDYGVHINNDDGSYPVPGSGTPPENALPKYDSSKEAAEVEQNSYSMVMFEFMPTKSLYLSIFDAVVWPMRYELDYIYPFNSKFFAQEVVGDFDNMIIGGTLAVLAPKFGQAWFSLYIDEMDPTEDEFFAKDRNMYATQIGTTISLPVFGLGKLNLQYTKIEPYTYTHPPVNSPSYKDPANSYNMETYYLNNGEPLGFYQPPNSDELRLDFTTMPTNRLMTSFKYRMIRHGATTGPLRVDGSSYYDYIDYYEYSGTYSSWKDDPLYSKDFLRDGAYEWQHVFGIGAAYFGKMGPVPYSLGVNYDFVWTYYTNYSATGDYGVYEDANYQSSVKNIISVTFFVYP